MGQSRLASYEMVEDVIKATNRYMEHAGPSPAMMGEAEIRLSFPAPTAEDDFDMLDEVEQLLELIEIPDA